MDNQSNGTIQADQMVTIEMPDVTETKTEESVPLSPISTIQLSPDIQAEQTKHAGGRPCEYCKNKEDRQKIAEDYLRKCRMRDGMKRTYPSIADLADLLNCDRKRIDEWSEKKKPDGELEHPEFHDTMLLVKNLQYSFLEQRVLGRFNPTGAMFLMRVNHGAVETSKQIQAGSTREPLNIIITEERPLPAET